MTLEQAIKYWTHPWLWPHLTRDVQASVVGKLRAAGVVDIWAYRYVRPASERRATR